MTNSAVLATQLKFIECRFTDSSAVATGVMTIIVKDRDNEVPVDLPFSLFGTRAQEYAAKFQGGDYVIMTGSIDVEKIETPNGNKNQYRLIANSIEPGVATCRLNNVCLVGRVGGEPDIKFFESGSVSAKFTLAINKRKKDVPPNWFNLQLWGKSAEVVGNYVGKGSQIGIEGSLGAEFWKDKQSGEDRMKWVIKGDRVELLGKGNGNGGGQAQSSQAVEDDDDF